MSHAEVRLQRAAVSRGLALGDGRVFLGTQDNFVVALNSADGSELWRTNVEDAEEFGCRITGAPLLVEGLVLVGSTGGDAAHRGHIVAFDVNTGQQRWRFDVIPSPGEKGHETWEGDSWKYGGGAAWMTGSYDPALDLIYWGTGKASSDFYGARRSGDNRYTSSIVALKRATGNLAWHFQVVPQDVWDYDAAYESILVDLAVNGQLRKLLIHPSKGGYTYVLDRTNGEFISGWKFVDNLTWSSGLDDKGVPQDRFEPVLNTPTVICPSWNGARSFNQATFSPQTGLLYNIGMEYCGEEFTARDEKMNPGRTWLWGAVRLVAPVLGSVISHVGVFDPIEGERVWRYEAKYPLLAALVSTAGNLVFSGDPEGNFFALDARTGRRLWSFQTGSDHRGGAVSYAVDGRQYVATPSGWGVARGESTASTFS